MLVGLSRCQRAASCSHRLLTATATTALAGPSSSSTNRHASSSARRFEDLTSAAEASREQSDLQPPPMPINPETYMHLDSEGNYMPDPQELQDDELGLTSQQRRLSPLGRLSQWQTGGPLELPPEINDSAHTAINGGNKALLKRDLRQSLAGELSVSGGVSRDRLSLLHLAATSPTRYASIRQVLATAAERFARLPGEHAWAPKRIEEHQCGVGEGAWAAAQTWPGQVKEWKGLDRRGHLLKQGRALAHYARDSDTPGNLSTMDLVSFDTGNSGLADLVPEDTLVLSAFNLLSLESDASREAHVKHLWKRGAESIVLIEEGTDRGFAAIASARALLLELGQEEMQEAREETTIMEGGREKLVIDGVEYFEERPEDKQALERTPDPETEESADTSTKRGCHVVAPCPHDRPCPLLHPFNVDNSFYTPFSPGDRPPTPSEHHHGGHVRMQACLHPVRYMPPPWARDALSEQKRRSKQKGGRELRSARFAYVVIKRGQRPTFEDGAKSPDKKSSAHKSELVNSEAIPSPTQTPTPTREELLAAAVKARQSRLDEMRRGESINRRHPEDIVGFSDESEGAMSSEGAEGDEEAKRELDKILADVLGQGAGPQHPEQDLSEAERSDNGTEEALNEALKSQQGGNSTPESVWEASAAAEEPRAAEAAADQKEEDITAFATEANEEWLASAAKQIEEAEVTDLAVPTSSHMPAKRVEDPHLSTAIAHMLPSLPRIIGPPIKSGGHVTFDACHQNGSIQRYTVSRSSGRQSYQEVRKSSWSDMWAQDPVESISDPSMSFKDGAGLTRWVKRRGWGQWSRVNPADLSRGLSKAAAKAAKNKGFQSSPSVSNRASNRPSAFIGADQVCPPRGPSSASQARRRSDNSRSSGYGLTTNADSRYTAPVHYKKISDRKKKKIRDLGGVEMTDSELFEHVLEEMHDEQEQEEAEARARQNKFRQKGSGGRRKRRVAFDAES